MSAGSDALGLKIGLENLVGGARIHIVRAREHPALHADVLHQVVHRRDRLLVRRSAGVEDVLRRLFTFVLHRVEQQAVVLLEHRQHRLARHAGPAAEHHVDLVLHQQLLGLLGEQRPVGRRIDDHGFELLAEQPALLVLLVDEHEDGVLERGLGDRHRSGQRVQHADLDGVGGLRRASPGSSRWQHRAPRAFL